MVNLLDPLFHKGKPRVMHKHGTERALSPLSRERDAYRERMRVHECKMYREIEPKHTANKAHTSEFRSVRKGGIDWRGRKRRVT